MEIKIYGAFVLNRRSTSTPSTRCSMSSVEINGRVIAENDLVKNCRVHPTHWLISTQVPLLPRPRATIDKMFEQFDLDENGKLDRRELRKAVQSSEDNRPTRAVHNIVVELRVMNSDVEAILDDADANDDGHIDRSEMLPALAAWSNIADMKIEKKKSRGAHSATPASAIVFGFYSPISALSFTSPLNALPGR